MESKTALGAFSPANPALQTPEPLSTTRAGRSSSQILRKKSENLNNYSVGFKWPTIYYILLSLSPFTAIV